MPKSAIKYSQYRAKREFRPQSRTRGYDRQWELLARSFRVEFPLCRMCLDAGVTRAAALVDHIVPVVIDPSLRLEWSNLQSLCRLCHAKKTAEDATKYA